MRSRWNPTVAPNAEAVYRRNRIARSHGPTSSFQVRTIAITNAANGNVSPMRLPMRCLLLKSRPQNAIVQSVIPQSAKHSHCGARLRTSRVYADSRTGSVFSWLRKGDSTSAGVPAISIAG